LQAGIQKGAKEKKKGRVKGDSKVMRKKKKKDFASLFTMENNCESAVLAEIKGEKMQDGGQKSFKKGERD